MVSPEMAAVIDFLEKMKTRAPADFEVTDLRKGLYKMVAVMKRSANGHAHPQPS